MPHAPAAIQPSSKWRGGIAGGAYACGCAGAHACGRTGGRLTEGPTPNDASTQLRFRIISMSQATTTTSNDRKEEEETCSLLSMAADSAQQVRMHGECRFSNIGFMVDCNGPHKFRGNGVVDLTRLIAEPHRSVV